MSRPKLKKPPLAEAILEIRWRLPTVAGDLQLDPNYRLLFGRLSDRLQSDYPEYEPLPLSAMPDAMAAYNVQHRFRRARGAYPLVQIGPGVLTLNETTDYDWDEFRKRTSAVVSTLIEAHPKPADLKLQSLSLRYINAIEFDHRTENICDFLESKMRVAVRLPHALFEGDAISQKPYNFSWQSAFFCQRPPGAVSLRFDNGMRGNIPVLRLETNVVSLEPDIPEMPGGFDSWIVAAHSILDNWFFKLIEGELEANFNHE